MVYQYYMKVSGKGGSEKKKFLFILVNLTCSRHNKEEWL